MAQHDMTRLDQELLALVETLHPAVPLMVVGGFGLVLWERDLMSHPQPTLRDAPRMRSTDDIDLMLTNDVTGDAHRMIALKDALENRHYTSTPRNPHWQFERRFLSDTGERVVIIDLLAPPPQTPEAASRIRFDDRRVKNRAAKKIHGHTTEEAFAAHESPRTIRLRTGEVLLPHPFTYMILKLHAFRDRADGRRDGPNPLKRGGRHHALDVYRILSLTTAKCWDENRVLSQRYTAHPGWLEAQRIVRDMFIVPDGIGRRRLEEAGQDVGRKLEVPAFVADLADWFGLERPAE